MINPIVKYGEKILQERSTTVSQITSETQTLIDRMIETMYAAPGIGLAAPQIGVPFRIFVVDLSVGHKPEDLIVAINPEFIELNGKQREEEGCLSIPGFTATVERPARVILKSLDRNGSEQTFEGTELLARAFQHEMDHLEGILFIDYLSKLKKTMIVKKLSKQKQAIERIVV